MKLTTLTLCALAIATMAAAQDTITLTVNGIGTCNVLSWTFGSPLQIPSAAQQLASGAGFTPPQIGPMTITKVVDSCTPGLMRLLVTGTHVTPITLTQMRDGVNVMTVELKNVLVSSDQINGSGSLTVGESLSLTFETIVVTFYTQSNTGALSGETVFGWDFVHNMPAS